MEYFENIVIELENGEFDRPLEGQLAYCNCLTKVNYLI
jgi:hypothetical protein